MRVLVQRTAKASVSIDNKIYNEIDNGIVVLVGFTEGDDISKIEYLVKKIVNLRIFPDEENIMNKSILEYGGEVLSISQFTLYADTSKGNRPSYIKALKSEQSTKLYDLFNKELEKYVTVKTGVFGEDMIVNINNVGPTTIILER
ncbi:MAG: D-tyrosyl-tRNA(Tyr) deacylase [Firmicutes bacterium]|nr:D-tyrosyl-tRNA(Tyr) deacylase [Bacillota bacterium]